MSDDYMPPTAFELEDFNPKTGHLHACGAITESDSTGGGIESPAVGLTEFLLARIAEDEEAARHPFGPWDGGRAYSLAFSGHGADHMNMTVDPAHVLSECGAKRDVIAAADHLLGAGCDSQHEIEGKEILRALASAYADHRDYDERWRP